MGQMYRKDAWDPVKLSQHSRKLKDEVLRIQTCAVELWEKMLQKGHFVTAWLLLEEGERKRHLLKGMEEACQNSSWHQDARALCPDIRIHPMLKQRGRAFTDFLNAYKEGKKGVGHRALYFVTSEWWEKAEQDIPQSLLGKFVESTFALMTLHRNEFICKPVNVHWQLQWLTSFLARFLLHSVMSVVQDLTHGSAGMNPVIDFMQTKGSFANAWSQTLADVRKKPIMRCYNCRKSPEEIGNSVKFMHAHAANPSLMSL
jgi:hypothetical protein